MMIKAVASINYDIWWVYKSEEHRPTYVDTMNRYLGFFDTSLHAHFVAFLVSLYSIYETRKDTLNVSQLLKILSTEQGIPQKALAAATDLYTEAKPLWIKVGILRNNAFGHRSESKTTAEVFEEAKITPDELKILIELTKQLLNTITLALDDSFHVFNATGTEATLSMLGDLKAYHESIFHTGVI